MARLAFLSEPRLVATVIDTDVVSYLYKRDTRAELYRQHLNDPPFIISFMSLAELRRWTLEAIGVKEGSKNWKTISRDTSSFIPKSECAPAGPKQ